MKVIGISGSARKDGNTAQMINMMFQKLNKHGIKTELIRFAGQTTKHTKAAAPRYSVNTLAVELFIGLW